MVIASFHHKVLCFHLKKLARIRKTILTDFRLRIDCTKSSKSFVNMGHCFPFCRVTNRMQCSACEGVYVCVREGVRVCMCVCVCV